MPKAIKLLLSLALPLFTGFIGSLFTTPSIAGWYAMLNKPSFNPPNWLFAPVWTTLFVLMGIAMYLVWQNQGVHKQTAITIFALQLILNVTWSGLFFALHSPGAALGEIIILWLAILANIIFFFRINKTAGLLLVPYLLWVSFATFLNFSIWRLNY